ncbi:MAG: hypothetical protein DSY47_02210 [Hydrogenothermus sp.]|nr:MAG: hypothetical protein DSY47_02210 [Hydrogenothermus sp.]
MKKDFIYTLITNIIVMVSGLLVYKLATLFFSIQGFAEYSLSKRIVSFLYPIFLLGLGVGITRYISISLKDKERIKNIMISSILLVFISSLGVLIIFEVFKEKFSLLLFGSAEYVFLMFPLAVTIIALLWHSLIYNYYRGKFEIKKANIIQLINLGIIPIVVFFISRDVAQLFIYNGLLVLIISSLIVLYIVIKEKMYKVVYLNQLIFREMKELFSYNIGRVPGDIGLAALFSLIPIFVTHLSSVKEGGIVAFGISLLNLTASFFATIGVVMLPKIGVLYSEKNYELIKKYMHKILKVSIFLSLLGVIIFFIFGDNILKMYLGKEIAAQSSVIKIIFLGTVPYVIYVSLRSIIDAIYTKPYNTINVLVSLLILLILSLSVYFFYKNYLYIIYIFLFSLYILAALTLEKILKFVREYG